MQRFILVDHSITGLAGHHYEYAVHVLRAAQAAGYQPVLVTNRKFREKGLPWEILPLFEFGFWPEARTAVSWRLAVKVIAWMAPRFSLARIRLRYSEIALAWESRYNWGKYLMRRRGEGAPLIVRSGAVAVVVFLQVFRLLCGAALLPVLLLVGVPAWLLFAAGRFLVRALKTLVRGDRPAAPPRFLNLVRSVLAIALSLARPGVIAQNLLARVHSRLNDRRPARPHQAEAFGRDASRMLRSLRPVGGDIVFFPTISEHDLRGLAERLEKTREGLEASWHFLFRRNIYDGARADYSSQDAGLEELRLIFERVQSTVLAGRSYFYTDTKELTEQYDRLGIVRFHTLPVPHTYTLSDRIRQSGPRRLTYLGDAREEKGFALLPELAAVLEPHYLAAGKAKLVLQCNYNIPGGEPPVAIARCALESMAGGFIEFHRKPLTSEEYRRLLLTADINLLCYDPRNYYARSSGIFVESLAAGIPVIVPGGCWLSRQFLDRQLNYIDEVRREMTTIAVKRLADLSWRDEQEPIGKLKPGELLRVQGDSGLHVSLEAPHGATHLFIRGKFATGVSAVVVTVSDIGWDEALAPGSGRDFCMESVSDSKQAAFLAELRPAPKIAISLRSAHPKQITWMNALDIEFLRAPVGRRFPRGTVGLIYDSPSQIPALVADLIDHYPHYERTAAEFSKSWREYHNPDRLLRDMERVAGITRIQSKSPLSRTERVVV
jgi:hypothetical protein